MALQYDAPTTGASLTTALDANTSISDSTLAAIQTILGSSGSTGSTSTVNVASFNGTTITAPSTGSVDLVMATIATPSDSAAVVQVQIPTAVLSTAHAYVFDTSANLQVRFNTIERVIVSGKGNDEMTVAGDKNTTLDGADGNDTLVTSGGNDSVTGGNGNDSISSGAGNDTIVSGTGNDTIDAGTGFDAVQMTGASSSYNIKVQNGYLVITDKTDATKVTTLKNTDIVKFGTDDTVVVAANETDATAMRLYEAVLDRSADADGADYWLTQLDNGQSLSSIASGFLSSTEFQAANGAMTNSEFVEYMYLNGLDRAAETAGKEYWTKQLADHALNRAEVAICIVGSAEAVATSDTVLIITGQI